MAWTSVTSFETTDGSTTPTDGNEIHNTGDGTGWSTNWAEVALSTSECIYDDDVAGIPDGSWVYECNTGATNNEPEIRRIIASAVTSGKVTVRVRKNKTNRNNNGYGLFSDLSLKTYAHFGPQASGNGDLLARNGGSDDTIGSAAQAADTWYKVDTDFDCSTDTYDVYLDNVKMNGTALNFQSTATSINIIRLTTGASSTAGSSAGTITYYDKIDDGEIAGPANLKTRDGVATANVKTITGIAIANVKTIDGIA